MVSRRTRFVAAAKNKKYDTQTEETALKLLEFFAKRSILYPHLGLSGLVSQRRKRRSKFTRETQLPGGLTLAQIKNQKTS